MLVVAYCHHRGGSYIFGVGTQEIHSAHKEMDFEVTVTPLADPGPGPSPVGKRRPKTTVALRDLDDDELGVLCRDLEKQWLRKTHSPVEE